MEEQAEQHQKWWQQLKKHLYALGIVVVLVFILFILSAYKFGWDWTGFNSGTSQITITSTSRGNYKAILSQPSKSLWDWLGLLALLAVPVVVGFGAAWFTAQQAQASEAANKRQHDTELEISTDNQREAALQAYVDKISELLLEHELGSEPKTLPIARARTLTVLRILDPIRTGSLIQFLSEAGLLDLCIGDELMRIDLHRANLV